MRERRLQEGLAAVLLAVSSLGPNASVSGAAPGPRKAKSASEYVLQSTSELAALEVEVSQTAAAESERQSVTDALLFVSKPGGDVATALAAANNEGASTNGAALFNVRLFVVAGGRLYAGARGQCGTWESDVSRCASSCDGGSFAIRRNGAAPLEVLVGAIAGGPAGAGQGVTVSACGFDEAGDAKLMPKGGRGLAVAGFGSD